MTKHNITKEQLLELTKKFSCRDITRKILHINDTSLNKLLIKFNIQKQPKYLRRIYQTITLEQKEFILGSLLGDMSIVKKGPQHRLSISHSIKQREYTEHQKIILNELALNNIQPAKSKAHNAKIFMNNQWETHIIKDFDGLILHSKVHPYFTELRNKLYINYNNEPRKTICDWWLNQLTRRSLAYWIMDDGSTDYADNSYVLRISTYSFTYNENLKLQQFLKQKFDLDINLQPVKNRGYGYCLRLNTENSKKLRDMIFEYVPDCMRYKVDKRAWLKWSTVKKTA